MRTRFEFDVATAATPDQVVELLTDFSPQRPDRWPALSAKSYEVYTVGETSADVREGQDLPPISATWHYDWSEPGTVTMTVTGGDDLAIGSYHTVIVRPAADGGSTVHGIWDNTAISNSARFGVLVMRLMGRRFFTTYYRRVFDQLAVRKT
ncbi:SRPBCC family protein [Nocardia cyriacigeorgica]|uniref:SRPBCC family protein n=1 Tax=Nocardia cyriacigeorgica TaxID=135487 RepID=UPI00245485F6|nr:SRPBCC family protein [Nocardia cyriacigeorgica]